MVDNLAFFDYSKNMREKVLKLLKANMPNYVSGEEIARALGVSRTAVWKNVNLLQEEGYVIEGSPRLGYRLIEVPDLLYPAEIAAGLKTVIIASEPAKIHYFRQVDSTSEAIKKLGDRGAPEGTLVVAEEQTGGKGRLGRRWFSPPAKGIWLSTLLRPPVLPREAPIFTLMSAVAVVKAIKSTLPHIPTGIKWPNDLLVNGRRKVCGILTELKAEADLLHYLVIGIGINVNLRKQDFPSQLQGCATSLLLENGEKELPRLPLLVKVLEELDTIYQEYLLKGPGNIIKSWKEKNITLNREVTVKSPLGEFTGRALDIAGDGALIVQNKKGEIKHFHGGEVTLS